MRGSYLSLALLVSSAVSCSGSILVPGAGDSVAPGQGGAGGDAPGDGGLNVDGALPRSRFQVRLSEIMYHPVVVDEPDSTYEFVEIFNAMDKAVILDHWTIDGAIQFEFPVGTALPAGEYLAIAKNRQKLAPVYGLAADKVIGDYTGELDNGGGRLVLIDAVGAAADDLKYDDKEKKGWPIGPDALGAAERWFTAPGDPRGDFSKHRHKGISLERVGFDLPTDQAATWGPSDLDKATPGAPNGIGARPQTILLDFGADRKVGDRLIRDADEVRIHAQAAGQAKIAGLDLEFFARADFQKSGESPTTMPMSPVAGSDNAYEITMPAQMQKANTIVRYRFYARDAAGKKTRISPRPTDPKDWHAYFVSPPKVVEDDDKGKRVYQIFITPENWGAMWSNAGALTDDIAGYARITTGPTGMEDHGCTYREGYNSEVPAIFVHDGIVSDAATRYQGSQFNRLRGEQLDSWSYPGPTRGPKPPLILAWRVGLPKYAALETDFAGKRTSVDIKKHVFYSCQAFPNYVENKLLETVGLASARVKFVRLYVNGGFYGYMADQGPVDDVIARRTEPDSKSVGDLFKANAFYTGPGRTTDGIPLDTNPECAGAHNSFPPCDATHVAPMCSTKPVGWKNELWDIYRFNYSRDTNSWKEQAIINDPKHPPDDAQILVEGLEAARKKDCPGVPPTMSCANITNRKQFLIDNFDLDKLRDEIAIRNWADPHDDLHHNYYLYKKALPDKDGVRRWLMLPWDLEGEIGGVLGYNVNPPKRSLYTGQYGNMDNFPPDVWNRFKDAYLRSFRAEYNARLREMLGVGKKCPPAPDPVGTVPGECMLKPGDQRTNPPSISNIIDDALAEFNQSDWDETVIKQTDKSPDAGMPRYPTPYQCIPTGNNGINAIDGMKQWVRDRYKYAVGAGAITP